MIETNHLKIYAASQEQMMAFIAEQSVDVLKAAYTEMLDGCLSHPDQWEWYAIWMIELKDGTHIGEICFKGITKEGITEIGYGIAEDYQGCGYATEAVSALTDWALLQPCINCVMAETEESNIASKKVLNKAGFIPTGEAGEEGPLYVRKKDERRDELQFVE
ncbi:MAG: GNAT family N-acetyltransferase [Clostridiales bacterium]|nr:GNAT family N-acetyltransferase [Candidatus Equinaster intestinalis]